MLFLCTIKFRDIKFPKYFLRTKYTLNNLWILENLKPKEQTSLCGVCLYIYVHIFIYIYIYIYISVCDRSSFS